MCDLERFSKIQSHISLPKSFSSGDVKEWFQRFEICTSGNGWEAGTKAKKLPMLLEGEALAVRTYKCTARRLC